MSHSNGASQLKPGGNRGNVLAEIAPHRRWRNLPAVPVPAHVNGNRACARQIVDDATPAVRVKSGGVTEERGGFRTYAFPNRDGNSVYFHESGSVHPRAPRSTSFHA